MVKNLYLVGLMLIANIQWGEASMKTAGEANNDYLMLAQKSTALYEIVRIGSEFTPLEESAIRDLARCLSEMSGANFDILDQKGNKPAIFVGVRQQKELRDRFAHLQTRDSFSIRTLRAPDSLTQLYLVGYDSKALAFAIYTFLEDLGCRWFMPGEFGEVIPKTSLLKWKIFERTEQPDFRFRQIWWAYGGPKETAQDFETWKLRNKVAFPYIQHGHNLTSTLPPKLYLESHPEYYALVDGKRQTTQICTSNPDVIRLVIERINAFYDQHPEAEVYSLCPDDNTDFCECANCRAMDAGGMDKYYTNKPVLSDRYIHFLNQVARGIQAQHPGKKVSTYAYVNYSTPPVREKIDPNVVIFFTSSVYCAAHGIGDLHCDSRQEMKRDLAGWTQAAEDVYIYDYDPVPYNAELPYPLFGARAREMSEYLAMGVKGFSFECHNSWATLAPNFYVAAKMMWNCRQDPDALLADYTQRFFGESAIPMQQYHQTLEAALSDVTEMIEWGQQSYPRIFTDEVQRRCRKALDAALAAATSETVRKRIEIVSLGFEYLENYISLRLVALKKHDYEEYKLKRQRCEQIIQQLYDMNKDFILHDVALDYLSKGLGELATNQYAVELGLVTDWMLIGPFDNTGNEGHNRVYAPEKEINFDKMYPGMEGKTIQWRHHQNPPWIGMIDFLPLFDEVGWVSAYATAVVESPEKQDVQIRLGSNDSVKMWLNGKEVWNNHLGRVVVMDDDTIPVTLPAGKSRILLKISNQGANWGFCFRITDEEGNKIPELQFTVE
ncbi:DUF4838 domain-containing protein [candidate division KSB1 bacterium]|nr:DUF4838 domain-containing protein [candidate division KSB1 bacterium]